MPYNLATAAASAGINKSTVLRAIKGGRISAQRNETGEWCIEPAEFHRVFPPLPAPATAEQPNEQLDAMTNALVAELRATIADLRQDRDHWRTAFENAQRQIPASTPQAATAEATVEVTEDRSSRSTDPGSRLRRAWRWMRA